MDRGPDIFAYLDYLAFLKAWVDHRRATDPTFSFTTFAQASGLSKSTLPNILAGTRTPRAATLDGLVRGLGLGPVERNYLEELVTIATAPTITARREALNRVTSRAAYRQKAWMEDRPSALEWFLARWYHVAIHELATLPGFRDDPEWVATALYPPIHRDQAAEALEKLFEHGLLARDATGRVVLPQLRLETRPEIHGEVVVRYHEELVPHLLARMRDTPADERHFVTATTTLAADSVAEAKQLAQQAADRFGTLGDADRQPGKRVYQIAIQVAPLSRVVDEG